MFNLPLTVLIVKFRFVDEFGAFPVHRTINSMVLVSSHTVVTVAEVPKMK